MIAATDRLTGRVVTSDDAAPASHRRLQEAAAHSAAAELPYLVRMTYKTSVGTFREGETVPERVAFRGLTTLRASHAGLSHDIPGAKRSDASGGGLASGLGTISGASRHTGLSATPSAYYIEGTAVLMHEAGVHTAETPTFRTVSATGGHQGKRRLLAEGVRGDEPVEMMATPLNGEEGWSPAPTMFRHREEARTMRVSEFLACVEAAVDAMDTDTPPAQREQEGGVAHDDDGEEEEEDDEASTRRTPATQCSMELLSAVRAREDVRQELLAMASDWKPMGALDFVSGLFPRSGLRTLFRTLAAAGPDGQAVLAKLLPVMVSKRSTNPFPDRATEHPSAAEVMAEVQQALANETPLTTVRSHAALVTLLESLMAVEHTAPVLADALVSAIGVVEGRIEADEAADPEFEHHHLRAHPVTADEDTLEHLFVAAGAVAWAARDDDTTSRAVLLEQLRSSFHDALDRHESVEAAVGAYLERATHIWEDMPDHHRSAVMASVRGHDNAAAADAAWMDMDTFHRTRVVNQTLLSLAQRHMVRDGWQHDGHGASLLSPTHHASPHVQRRLNAGRRAVHQPNFKSAGEAQQVWMKATVAHPITARLQHAIRGLSNAADVDYAEQVAALLSHRRATIRQEAASALATMPSVPARRHLVATFHRPEELPQVRLTAFGAMAGWPRDVAEAASDDSMTLSTASVHYLAHQDEPLRGLEACLAHCPVASGRASPTGFQRSSNTAWSGCRNNCKAHHDRLLGLDALAAAAVSAELPEPSVEQFGAASAAGEDPLEGRTAAAKQVIRRLLAAGRADGASSSHHLEHTVSRAHARYLVALRPLRHNARTAAGMASARTRFSVEQINEWVLGFGKRGLIGAFLGDIMNAEGHADVSRMTGIGMLDTSFLSSVFAESYIIFITLTLFKAIAQFEGLVPWLPVMAPDLIGGERSGRAAAFFPHQTSLDFRLAQQLEAFTVVVEEYWPKLAALPESINMMAVTQDATYEAVVDSQPYAAIVQKFMNDTDDVLGRRQWASAVTTRAASFIARAKPLAQGKVMEGAVEVADTVKEKIVTLLHLGKTLGHFEADVHGLATELPARLAKFAATADVAMGRMSEELQFMDSAFAEYGSLDPETPADEIAGMTEEAAAILAANAVPTVNETLTTVLSAAENLPEHITALREIMEVVIPSETTLRDAWLNSRAVREGLHFLQTADLTNPDALRSATVNFLVSAAGDAVLDHADAAGTVLSLLRGWSNGEMTALPAFVAPLLSDRVSQITNTDAAAATTPASTSSASTLSELRTIVASLANADMGASVEAQRTAAGDAAVDAWAQALVVGAGWVDSLGSDDGDLSLASSDADSWLQNVAPPTLKRIQGAASELFASSFTSTVGDVATTLEGNALADASSLTSDFEAGDKMWRVAQLVSGVQFDVRPDYEDTGAGPLETAVTARQAVHAAVLDLGGVDSIAGLAFEKLGPALVMAANGTLPDAEERPASQLAYGALLDAVAADKTVSGPTATVSTSFDYVEDNQKTFSQLAKAQVWKALTKLSPNVNTYWYTPIPLRAGAARWYREARANNAFGPDCATNVR